MNGFKTILRCIRNGWNLSKRIWWMKLMLLSCSHASFGTEISANFTTSVRINRIFGRFVEFATFGSEIDWSSDFARISEQWSEILREFCICQLKWEKTKKNPLMWMKLRTPGWEVICPWCLMQILLYPLACVTCSCAHCGWGNSSSAGYGLSYSGWVIWYCGCR